jgi:hypothetical protein
LTCAAIIAEQFYLNEVSSSSVHISQNKEKKKKKKEHLLPYTMNVINLHVIKIMNLKNN